MANRLIRIFSGILCAVFLLTAAGCSLAARQQTTSPEQYRTEGTAYDAAIRGADGFCKVAENRRFCLDVLNTYAEIRVTDKQTGQVWYSNPPGRLDGIEGNVSRVNSQVIVQYTVNDAAYSYTSFGDAILNDQYSFSQIPDGIRVNFRLGEYRRDYVVPQVIDQARWAQIMGALSEDDRLNLSQYYELISVKDDSMDRESRALILNKFPVLAEKDCYVCQLRTSITGSSDGQFANEYLLKKIETLFLAAGYTAEQLAQDNEVNRVSGKMFQDTSIALSVEYALEDDGLTVRIPKDSIAFDDSLLQLTAIRVLPFFGAADTDEQGYIFVPDGSGALIRLNNGKTAMAAYDKAVYGQDLTIPAEKNTAADPSDGQIFLPVFGIKTAQSAFLAIIEDGAGVARINADISGKGSAYNTAYAAFAVNSSQKPATLSLNAQYGSFYQEQIAQCDYCIHYRFLYGGEATYTGMAREYQRYLTGKGALTRKENAGKAALFLDILQAVDHKQVVLGVPVSRPLALTTCDQAAEILRLLSEAGVDTVHMQLSGWANGGVNHTAMNRVRWMGCLGGRKGYLALADRVKAQGGSLSVLCDFQYVPKLTPFDGYSPNTHSARTLENVASYGENGTVVSPLYYERMTASFTGQFAAETYGGLSLGNMGADLNGDYHSGRMLDRQAALEKVTAQMELLASQGYALTLTRANAYAFPYATLISSVPLTSGKENLFDESVPFYQIVLSGYVPYSSEPLNQVSDYDEAMLKILETGTLPSFMWMYADNIVLKDTDYSHYYSACYRTWLKKAAALYTEVNAALGDCLGHAIAAHDTVADGVYCTTYENGVSLYVNYRNSAVTVGSVTVPARGYTRYEGGTQ